MTGKRKSDSGFNKKILPLMMLMVVPLIMYYQVISYDTVITKPNYVMADHYGDIFSFYKSIAIYAVAAFCILFYILYTNKNDRELRKDRLKYYIPAVIYGIFIILSSIFAIYPKGAWLGIYERYEGALVLLSYLIIMVYTIEIVRDRKDVEFLLYGFLCMTTVVAAIGIFQYFGLDPFKTNVFQRLIGIPETAEVTATFGKMAYSTLYNPNNVGQFTALTIPITAGMAMAIQKRGWKIFAVIVLAMDIFLAFAADSANAFAGLAAAGFVFTLLFISHLIPKSKTGRIITGVIVLCLIGVVVVAGRPLFHRIINSTPVQMEIKSILPDEDDIYINDIDYSPKNIRLDTNQGVFNLNYRNSGITFLDSDMRAIEFEQKGSTINFIHEPYKSSFRITIDTEATLSVYAKRAYRYTRIEVVFNDEQFLGLRGTGGRIIRDIPENQMPYRFRGLETIASRRGYLWFASLGRFDEIIFIGAGPDNFLYWFDQNDIIGKLNMLHRTNVLADKPHNWYIQMATQTGLISLLAVLALAGIFIVTALKKIGLRRKKYFFEFLGAGIVCGLTGYMTSALFVDSTVSVTPLFFFFLGLGIVCVEQVAEIRRKNRLLEKK